ncbi:MAG: leucine--tRNA ligase [Candidatus Paceibacterota bacterium]
MENYNHLKIEKKWQKEWEKSGIFKSPSKSKKKKFYSLIEFPYPSGEGLHVGHVRSNTAMDIISRKRRMEGFNVLYPIGWDAFGLPTENYAIKTSTPPEIVTKINTDNFRRQLKSLGFSFDWDREINTTDPKYYKWTQWIFLQMYKKGLAYKKKMIINWCPKDKIGLANEEVINGCCERCGTLVEKKEKEQWMLAITKYTERLHKDLDEVDYLPQIKTQQRNWIGKSEGAEIKFKIEKSKVKVGEVEVFTTRPDTIFGATYVVLSPEHELIEEFKNQNSKIKIDNLDEVLDYVAGAKKKDDIERTAEGKEKTGVEIKGIKAINSANGEEIPVWVADYVLVYYGTGAVMAVPAHDERDFEFATKYNLPIKEVIKNTSFPDACFLDEGILVNSSKFDGRNSEEVKKDITKFVGGEWVTKFKLRDWVFSRQRYWGEPIPLVHCEKCGTVPLPEKDLPLKLPKVDKYEPTDTGESPLANISKWVNTKCPKCKGNAKRETDTMPQWAGSSWYYLRYTDPKNNKKFADPKNLKYFTPVDWYNGGMEHTTLHLLYSRFWHKFLYDLKLVPTKEPYKKRTSHGMILAGGGEKMSKSKGNVVNPDTIVWTYGADTLRLYEMFMGPFDQSISWAEENIVGVRRFIERVWKIGNTYDFGNRTSKALESVLHKTVKKVSDDIETMSFNTAISSMMILVNEIEKEKKISKKDFEVFLKILSPFSPHLSEELWSILGNKKSISLEKWPKAVISKMEESEVTIAVQINGKFRAKFRAKKGVKTSEIEELVKGLEEVSKWLKGKKILKVVNIPDILVNFVTE